MVFGDAKAMLGSIVKELSRGGALNGPL
jgi:hypothetical protein